ncbi:MAG: hypothetical protein CFE24_01915 [Flavobacterium sp. BFFFF2]|nr:MAG: hypothetical protein CFE24_01915 [Flavobacterium sp. BFFFF2]
MKNPWEKFIEDFDEKNLILEEEKAVIDKFNQNVNETYKIHTEIMPAPFMGNVKTAPILLLVLNPGYDEKEEENGFYKDCKHFWKSEIQHIQSIPELPLFCLDEKYISYSDYWAKKLKPLTLITSKEKVAKNICKIQFFPYHSKKFKSITKKILVENGFDKYLPSQQYNFELVKKAMERNSIIIILRSKKMWFEAIPELEKYENLHVTKSYLNTILSENNLLEAFPKIVNILNK